MQKRTANILKLALEQYSEVEDSLGAEKIYTTLLPVAHETELPSCSGHESKQKLSTENNRVAEIISERKQDNIEIGSEVIDDDLPYEPDIEQLEKSESDLEEDSLEGVSEKEPERNRGKETDKSRTEIKGRPKKGRKRKFASQNREIRKLKCIQNETYYTQRGLIKERKEFNDHLCKCSCLEKIGVKKVKQEYLKIYNVSSHDAQRALICAMVREIPVKRKRVKDSEKRNWTRQYTINDITVCKSFFLKTFSVSSGKIDLALKSIKRPEGLKDLRGIGGGKNKISDERFKEVFDHINKFPKYKFHYSREQTESMYLRSDTTLPVMYNLYKTEVSTPVSFSKYKNIFLTCFNLKRKPLKKDTCNTCDKSEHLQSSGNNAEQNKFKEQKEAHLHAAEEARNLLKADRKRAKEEDALEVLCFHMEKTLPLPRIPTNVVFYKRQLWLYNLGIHTSKKDEGHCYVWLEGKAGRGAQEVGYCLLNHIEQETNIRMIKHLILWSDSCGGQNRNIKIVLLLKTVFDTHPNLSKITIRFLKSGHSFLPNDADFGDIECALKLQQRLYTLVDYIEIMKNCRRKNPLKVHKMGKFFGTIDYRKKYNQ